MVGGDAQKAGLEVDVLLVDGVAVGAAESEHVLVGSIISLRRVRAVISASLFLFRPFSLSLYIYTYINKQRYINIYILTRARVGSERRRPEGGWRSHITHTHTHIYIHIYMYIYIYINRARVGSERRRRAEHRHSHILYTDIDIDR